MKTLLRVFFALALLTGAAQADDMVYAVQKKLARGGYYQGTVDGEMGSQTAAAIRRYQLAENLRVTGTLNPETLRSLGISTQAPPPPPRYAPSQPQPTPVPEWVAIAAIFKGGPYIEAPPEVQINTIRQAQKTLNLLGYYRGPINGSPNSSLVSALKVWQRDAGFRQTGRFDENTLKGLNIMRY